MDFPLRCAPPAPTGGNTPKGRDVPAAMIEIIADDRERNGGVIDRLRGHEEVSLVVERLPLGDYLIDAVLLIERKTLSDLVASIKDGRLFGQAHRLAGWPLWKAFILEGTATDLAGSGMRREAIQPAYLTGDCRPGGIRSRARAGVSEIRSHSYGLSERQASARETARTVIGWRHSHVVCCGN